MADVVQVGWVDSPENDLTIMVLAHARGDSLEIQHTPNHRRDGSDQDLGDYCLVRDAGPTYYGGVRRHRVVKDILELELTAQAAEVLQLPPVTWFQLPAAETARVRRWLADVLR